MEIELKKFVQLLKYEPGDDSRYFKRVFAVVLALVLFVVIRKIDKITMSEASILACFEKLIVLSAIVLGAVFVLVLILVLKKQTIMWGSNEIGGFISVVSSSDFMNFLLELPKKAIGY